MSMLLLMNFTDPSPSRTCTPPVWAELIGLFDPKLSPTPGQFTSLSMRGGVGRVPDGVDVELAVQTSPPNRPVPGRSSSGYPSESRESR